MKFKNKMENAVNNEINPCRAMTNASDFTNKRSNQIDSSSTEKQRRY